MTGKHLEASVERRFSLHCGALRERERDSERFGEIQRERFGEREPLIDVGCPSSTHKASICCLSLVERGFNAWEIH